MGSIARQQLDALTAELEPPINPFPMVTRVPAVLTVMVLVTLLLAAFAGLVASQLTQLAQQLPTYEANLRQKTHELAGAAPGRGIIDRTADFMRDFSREIDRLTAGQTGEQGAAATVATTDEPPVPMVYV